MQTLPDVSQAGSRLSRPPNATDVIVLCRGVDATFGSYNGGQKQKGEYAKPI